MVKANNSIHELYLSGNNISVEVTGKLIQSWENSKVKIIDLSSQGIFAGLGDDGLAAIYRNVTSKMQLEELYFDNNGITKNLSFY